MPQKAVFCRIGSLVAGLLAGALLAGAALGAPRGGEGLIGTSAPIFSLPSTTGGVVNYDRDFYGKHHLVLTFFPAAFTPV